MKKIFSAIIFSSLLALAIPPSVEAHKYKAVDSYKACQKYAKKINMTCEEAIEAGVIIIIHSMPWE